jgi:integrase
LEFTLLTAARSGEARGAVWSEFDLAKKTWVIPAGRMKSGKEHRVPLSVRSLEILQAMKETAINDLVFPGRRDRRPLSDMTLAKALKAAKAADFTVHGFRSSFRDWVSEETRFPRELAEVALSHSVGDAVERAYRRGDALEKRRELMQAWANYCAGIGGETVIQLRRTEDA